jgi:hypothetical protein
MKIRVLRSGLLDPSNAHSTSKYIASLELCPEPASCVARAHILLQYLTLPPRVTGVNSFA